ncbi:hypothetical protein HNQ94_000383 [Salirhabdus euzebyi]|uniref:Uncharacterized protein n=1 Tax=Salirhabdus euzebyi TaxID=394506 RepID=A0A841Q1J6_9BACI|nr:hypothetical protein [Salirhabdus euzebyi]MBB6451962.1 hypothetical protein [Salirhabdus euzebyi]
MKTEVIDFRSFVRGDYVRSTKKETILKHMEQNKTPYTVAGLTCVFVFGSGFDYVYASTGIDGKAKEIFYGKLLPIAKWGIILKGGWDIFMKALREDFEGIKKTFIAYGAGYAAILVLPWGLSQVEGLFGSGS